MLGAIAGDIIGSPYEWAGIKTTDFPLFESDCKYTDDTVMTVATAHALLTGMPYERAYHELGTRYPRAGYGQHFRDWLMMSATQPYGSWGNGSAMRVAPVAWARDSEDDVLAEAERSAAVTHDHPEGIKGAQAVALAVYLARTGSTKEDIRDRVTRVTGYDLERRLDDIRPGYDFDVSCQGSVPEALIAFLESDSVESAIRLAVSLGGDCDTQACMAGAVAEAFYGGVPPELATPALERLPADLHDIYRDFERTFVVPRRRPNAPA
jgi:ADP-ribosylglycohydrolase